MLGKWLEDKTIIALRNGDANEEIYLISEPIQVSPQNDRYNKQANKWSQFESIN